MTEQDVRRVFVDVLDLTEPVDWDTVGYQSTQTWDSLVHMALVARLESEFGITLSDEDIIAMDSYASAVQIVRSRSGDG